MLIIADDLHERGIGVRILTGKLSGSYSPAGEGKFFFTVMVACVRRESWSGIIIHERAHHGLAWAAARATVDAAAAAPIVMDEDKLATPAQGAARARREPREDRQGTRRQPGLGLPPPRR